MLYLLVMLLIQLFVESNLFRVVDGKLQAKIPNILQDRIGFDTGYSSYEEFVAKDGVLVTDLGNVTDSKGISLVTLIILAMFIIGLLLL